MVVIIPAYGLEEITATVVGDIAREADNGKEEIDCLIVDNAGGYTARWRETVISPGTNLGWLRGTNTGIEHVRDKGYDAYVLLNNDVRLSPGFFAGLVRAQKLTGAGLLGPAYDSLIGHQRVPYDGTAAEYKPKRRHWKASMIDGTCMYVPATTLDRVGLLDDRFLPHGWGAEIDYSFRVWDAGMTVVITALSFLNHQQGSTVFSMFEKDYQDEAWRIMREGLAEKYGTGSKGWGPRAGIDAETYTTPELSNRDRYLATLKAELGGRLRR